MTRLSERPLGPIHLVADLDAAPDFAASEPALRKRVRMLLAGGLPSLQLRGKGRGTRELVQAGARLRELAAEAGALFLVNGDLAAALALRADGVHLPAAGPSVAEARSRLPAGALVGVSCHDPAELARAREADWVFVSPVRPTRSKPGAVPLGMAGLRALVARAVPPVYALGGLGAADLRPCRAAGAAGIAAIRSLLGPDGERLLARASER